jgi:hypothetical protein
LSFEEHDVDKQEQNQEEKHQNSVAKLVVVKLQQMLYVTHNHFSSQFRFSESACAKQDGHLFKTKSKKKTLPPKNQMQTSIRASPLIPHLMYVSMQI